MLRELLEKTVEVGRLTVRIGNDVPFSVGAVPIDHPELDVAIHIQDRWIANLLALDPEYQLGTAYMNGTLVIEQGTLSDFMALIGHNLARRPRWDRLTQAGEAIGRRLTRANSLALARRNAAHHYDHSDAFYRLFLDEDLQYSCAYFERPGMTLEAAQIAKKAHIAAKLALQPGQHVLDIGCGWGGLALSLARMADVTVTGITLSAEQLRVARTRAQEAGFADRVRFELIDYRALEGRFDRIVSVGMFEHVGRAHYGAYFDAIDRLLTDEGVALVHSIGRKDPGPGSSRWMRRHIFPGGYIPAASEAIAALEQTGLWLADMEVLRLHYAETLRHWRERAEASRRRIEALYDERFYRMWTYYLASCEMAFRFNGLMVFQLQISRRIDTLPTTRGYMAEEERALLQAVCPGPAEKRRRAAEPQAETRAMSE